MSAGHSESSETLILGENGLHDLTVDVGETEVAALVFVGEGGVIDAKEMQNGGLDILNSVS